MNILIIDNHTKQLENLYSLLKGNNVSVCKREKITLKKLETSDLVIISGGSNVCPITNHRKEYEKEIDFLKKTDKPVIGICLGFEIIATAFGSSLKKLEFQQKGIYKIKFKGRNIEVYEAHKFGVKKISGCLKALATSKNGPEIIKHKIKPIYGLQFHPEMFVRKTDGDEVFNKILSEFLKK